MRNKGIGRLVGAGLAASALTAGVFAGAVSAGAAVQPRVLHTMTVPYAPGSTVTSVFPYYTGAQCTTVNIDYWNLQVRPGYWFGLGSSLALQPALAPL